MQTIGSALKTFQNALEPHHGKREAQAMAYMALQHPLGCGKAQLLANANEALDAGQRQRLQEMLQRLLAGEPIQYVLGVADFYGLRLLVNPQVLIPRPETEELVEWVLQHAKTLDESGNGMSLLDVGTGSGCIALALKKELPNAEVWATDISPGALQTAAHNARNCGLRIHLALQSIFNATKAGGGGTGRHHIIVSNPPYITEAERGHLPKNVLDHEPHTALFTQSESPLTFYGAIADHARQNLLPGGRLFFELNQYHAQQIGEMVESKGFEKVQLKNDLNGAQRLLSAQKPT